MTTHTSIVQNLICRSVTGRGIGLTVHTHAGWTVHASWNSGVDKGNYKNCIARHTLQSGVWYATIRQLRRRSLTGLCKCVYRAVTRYERETLAESYFHTYREEIKRLLSVYF